MRKLRLVIVAAVSAILGDDPGLSVSVSAEKTQAAGGAYLSSPTQS